MDQAVLPVSFNSFQISVMFLGVGDDELGAILVGELFAFIPKALKGETSGGDAVGDRAFDRLRYPLAMVHGGWSSVSIAVVQGYLCLKATTTDNIHCVRLNRMNH